MATEKQNADELKARIAELPSGYMASVRCFFYSVIFRIHHHPLTIVAVLCYFIHDSKPVLTYVF